MSALDTLFPMRSGLRFDLLNPTPQMVTTDDVAWALAHTLRYGGHSAVPINVASHSLNVASLVEEWTPRSDLRLAALLHDAHEAYLGDVIRPLKNLIRDAWQPIEDRCDAVIAEFYMFDVELLHDPLIKKADMAVYCWERRDLVGVPAWDDAVESSPDARCPNPSSAEAFRKFRDEIAFRAANWWARS